MSRKNVHGPKNVRAIEVQPYLYKAKLIIWDARSKTNTFAHERPTKIQICLRIRVVIENIKLTRYLKHL